MNEKVSEDNIIQVDISQEMKSSYLDYSMSVIVGRALPDARDGLKPVHRRILYGMYQMGLRPDSAYKKSARVVGEVMGKYHPHGDMALYDALVRMAQGFSMRYQLVDGQGNFGSVDGDSPAAMRYTEARLTPIAMTMLADIEKQTVNFVPNFDDTMKEPVVLPTMIPNLILNGSDGIAVGMATRIPPHNLSEVVSAIIELIKDPKMDTNELLKYVKGPDFPTGGYIVGRKGITDAYKRGRGKITIRAKINEEVSQTGRKRLVVSEIPFQVNKARLIEQIAELVRNRKIEGISDIRDESDREGLRVVIELKRGEDVKSVIHKLLKLTSLETTFGIIMLALDDGRPRILTLKEILEIFIKHRREVVTRRSEFLLNKAEERAHILQGLMVAVDNIDEVVAIIKKASDVDNARRTLMKRFKLSESQAQAILDMKLSRLTTMERRKIAEELENTLKEIDYLRAILGAPELLDEEIVKELKTIRERFGDERKTTIIDEDEIAGSYEVIPREEQVVIVTRAGYLKRMSETSFTRLRSRIMPVDKDKDIDYPIQIIRCDYDDNLMVFTEEGRCYSPKVSLLPEVGGGQRGKTLRVLLGSEREERISFAISTKDGNERYIVFVTKNGLIKRSKLNLFFNARRKGIIAMILKNGDRVVSGTLTTGKDDLIVSTARGQVIRLSEEDIRPSGRNAGGVIGIKLLKDDHVIKITNAEDKKFLILVTSSGYMKKVSLNEFGKKRRASMGVKSFSDIVIVGEVISVEAVNNEDTVLVSLSNGKTYQLSVAKVKELKRSSRGVKIKEVTGRKRVMNLIKFPVR